MVNNQQFNSIPIEDKVTIINSYFQNQLDNCEELMEYSQSIALELQQLKIDNARCLDIIQSQNLILSQMSMLLIKIKDIEDKKFHNILKQYEIDLSSISEQIH